MPRTARAIEAGLIYHVLNRGNGRLRLFRKDEDFAAFERVLAEREYFVGGLRKIEAARAVAEHMDPERNVSTSFRALRDALAEMVGAGGDRSQERPG